MLQERRLTIKNWSEEDRPREKYAVKGASTLSDAELLAILLGSGNRDESAVELARRLLREHDNNLSCLGRASLEKITTYQGIGQAKGITVLAAMELGRRRSREHSIEQPAIRSSSQLDQYFRSFLADLEYEEFWILLLNRSNRIIDRFQISKGGVAGTTVDLRLIFKLAIQHLASGIVLGHNHPSGNKKPSLSDLRITRRIVETGDLLQIPILDHIIVTPNGYTSFADESLI